MWPAEKGETAFVLERSVAPFVLSWEELKEEEEEAAVDVGFD